MSDTFLKNELCDTEIFELASSAGRLHEVQPEEIKFLNLNKTVKLAAEQLHMSGEVPQIVIYEHPSPAFAVHTRSNSLHITEGLYDKLNNEQLRAVMILQTCLTHHAHEHEGKYHAANVIGLAAGSAAGAVSGAVIPGGIKSIIATLQSSEGIEVIQKPTSRRAFLGQVSGAAFAGLAVGGYAGKQADNQRESKNWVQAAVADYAALSGDHDKTLLLGALTKMNNGLGEDRKQQFRECRKAIGQFMAYAINTDASRLMELPSTEKTRTYSKGGFAGRE